LGGGKYDEANVGESRVAVSWLAATAALAANQQPCTQAGAEKYITDSEAAWAESVATGDASVVRRILAEDFAGVDSDGSVYNKQKAIAEATAGPSGFLSNHLDAVRIRFFGDTAVAQGSETWVRKQKDGTTVRKRFVWVDAWWCRGGLWQIVSAEDLIAPAKD
jgi:ketosteroid isomerase-like protein